MAEQWARRVVLRWSPAPRPSPRRPFWRRWRRRRGGRRRTGPGWAARNDGRGGNKGKVFGGKTGHAGEGRRRGADTGTGVHATFRSFHTCGTQRSIIQHRWKLPQIFRLSDEIHRSSRKEHCFAGPLENQQLLLDTATRRDSTRQNLNFAGQHLCCQTDAQMARPASEPPLTVAQLHAAVHFLDDAAGGPAQNLTKGVATFGDNAGSSGPAAAAVVGEKKREAG